MQLEVGRSSGGMIAALLDELLEAQSRLRIVRAWWADTISADDALMLLLACDLIGLDLVEAPAP